MAKVLAISMCAVDPEKSTVINPLTLITPKVGDKGKITLNKTQVPLITFTPDQLPAVQGLIAQLMEVVSYPETVKDDVVILTDHNVVLVEKPDDPKSASKPR